MGNKKASRRKAIAGLLYFNKKIMTNEDFIKKLVELPTIEIMFAEVLKQEGSMRNVSFATGIQLSIVSKLASGKKILRQDNWFKLIKRFVLGREYIPTSNPLLIPLFKKKQHCKWCEIACDLKVTTPYLFGVIAGRLEVSRDLEDKIMTFLYVENKVKNNQNNG